MCMDELIYISVVAFPHRTSPVSDLMCKVCQWTLQGRTEHCQTLYMCTEPNKDDSFSTNNWLCEQ